MKRLMRQPTVLENGHRFYKWNDLTKKTAEKYGYDFNGY